MTDVYNSSPPASKKDSLTAEVDKTREWWKILIDEILEKVGLQPGSSMMGTFCVRPGTRFIDQQEDEEIILLLRAHPITNIGWVLLALVMLLLPSFILSFGVFDEVPGKFLFVGQITWYLVTLMFAFEKFLKWFYSVFIVTNERLVDIDFDNLTYRNITDANLNHIEEPAMVTSGFVRTMFQYGDIFVTSASEHPTVEALAIPWPQKVVDIISRLSEELEKRRELGK